MHQHIGLADLVQGALESLHQLGGQLADKAYSVAQEERHVLYHHFAHGGIQRSKELVLRKDVGLGEQIHQGALPHIGIAHQGQAHQRASVAPLRGHLLVHLLKVLLEFGDALLDNTAVDFNLGFTHTAAGSHTASLALQVRPHACQARKHVVVMGQLHLHFGVGGFGPLGKDFQDKGCPVDNVRAGNHLFDVALLHAREFIVKDDVLNLVLLAVFLDFLQFSGADIGSLVRAVQPLGEHFVRECAGGLGQKGELVQVFLHFAFAALFQDDAHKYRFVSFKFAHTSTKIQKNRSPAKPPCWNG